MTLACKSAIPQNYTYNAEYIVCPHVDVKYS